MGLDGWLLFEFHGHNPVAASLLGLEATTRRSFALIPREGEPRALIHRIEGSAWRTWPWERRTYAGWRELEEELTVLVSGTGRLAMEISPGSAVPTLDLVPSGVVDLVRQRGVELVSSGDLVTRFHATWTPRQWKTHRRTAETVARVARDAMAEAAERVGEGRPLDEGTLSRWILSELEARGVGEDRDCIVAVGDRASDPHYAPDGAGEVIGPGRLLLVDLWGRPTPGDVFADQTWMGYLGPELPPEISEIWRAVRDARDAGLDFLRARHREGREVRGAEVDDRVRRVISDRGWGEAFVHRTGHSIDTELHGSGPNLDNLETRDDRRLVPGVGFSVEPGIYLPGRIGVRSEVNVHWGSDGVEVTPEEVQEEVFLLLDE